VYKAILLKKEKLRGDSNSARFKVKAATAERMPDVPDRKKVLGKMKNCRGDRLREGKREEGRENAA